MCDIRSNILAKWWVVPNHVSLFCLELLYLEIVLVGGGLYVSRVLKLLYFKVSLYKGAVASNIYLLQDNVLMHLLIGKGKCRITKGG